MGWEWTIFAAGFLLIVGSLVLLFQGRGEAGEGEVTVFGITAKKLGQAVMLAVLGVIAIGWGVVTTTDDETTTAALRGSVTEIVDAPPFPDVSELEGVDQEKALGAEWLGRFLDVRIVVDFEKTVGIRRGDYLAVLQPTSLPQGETIDADELGALADTSAATLEIDQVFDEKVFASLDSFGIEAFIEAFPPNTSPGDVLFPVERDHVAFAIPTLEGQAFDKAQALLANSNDTRIGDDVRADRQRIALRELRSFREAYPGSFFSPTCMFDEAFLLWEMGRPDDAKEVFELFIDRFPRNPSVPGARDHLERIEAGEATPPPWENAE